MNNVRIEYNKGAYLFDKTLSLKAKGIMALMVGYINKNSAKAIFTLEDVRDLSCDGITAFNNAISELKAHDYMTMNKSGNGFRGSPWVFTLKE